MSDTEKEREICVFYQRIGACRHGPKCSRVHKPPRSSKTVLIRNLFRHVQPLACRITSNSPDDFSIFEDFYEEVFTEIEDSYGRINQMHVCENMGEHLIGNVYAKFTSYSSAKRAVEGLNNRYFAGFPIFAELSPVDNFRDAVCRQHDHGECTRGGFCNFLHIKHISTVLEDKLDKRSCSSLSTDEESSTVSDSELSSSESSSSEKSRNFSDFSNSKKSKKPNNSSDSSNESESTSRNDSEDEDSGEEDPKVPKAFRTRPLKIKSPGSSPEFEEENEFTKEYLRTGRRLRWKIFQKKLLEEPWDDAKERQYVFNLLDLT
ncbi:hypothetical protein FO519_002190 [Halicephalobus sp. NKZ332]|nr:hypothetical protein FO519_002190 [Halicephalobus sp. NKZ332]